MTNAAVLDGALAGIAPRTRVEPSLVREVDAPEVRGDHQLLSSLTGRLPRIPLSQTLADVWADVSGAVTGHAARKAGR